jgi:probable HAF family extracellular repeat protein
MEGSTATHINDTGQVVGVGSGVAGQHAFLWTPDMPNGSEGSMTDLGDLPGGLSYSGASSINSHGQVVGLATIDVPLGESGTRAFLWMSSLGMVNLNDYLDPISGDGWTLHRAWDINDAGQIVGSGLYNGVGRGFLLTPIPEPTSLALLTISVVVFGLKTRESRRDSSAFDGLSETRIDRGGHSNH